MGNELITVGVIGSGTMGSGIAQVSALAGNQILLYDTNHSVLEKAKNSIENSLEKLLSKSKISSEELNSAKEKIRYSSKLKDFDSCSLIVEAIPEDLHLKQNLFKELENIVNEKCILGTNTSSLSIASISSNLKMPSRFIGIHFFNPANILPLVEVVPSLFTDKEISNIVMDLMKKWGKTPVLAKDTPGFIVNRIARHYYGEALRIYEEGIANTATIDWAMKEFGGFKMGPFELMDLIGNDINYKVTETIWEQFYYDPKFKPSIIQKRMVEAGLLGRKTGRGFYNYSEGTENKHPIQDENLGRIIFERILSMLINEAADALYYGIASKEDIDMAMVKGVNYPKGLIEWGNKFGFDRVLNIMKELQEFYGDSRYRQSPILRKML